MFMLSSMSGSESVKAFLLFVYICIVVGDQIIRGGWGRHGHDHMVVGFTATCAISAYHH
jgi:hypothetical protein